MGALRELLASFHISVDDKEIDKSEEKIGGFIDALKRAGTLVAEAFAVHEIKEFVESQVHAASELERTALILGTTTDELQAMQLAAAQSSVSSESLSTGLRMLNRSLAQAQEAGSKQAAVFKDLGISLKDDVTGKARSSTEVMAEFADAIAAVHDPTKQTQIAMELLGRHGAALLPMLKKGGDALRGAREQVEALGGGISEDFIKQAAASETATARMNVALSGFKTHIASAILPGIEKLVVWMTKGIVAIIDFTKHTKVVQSALMVLGGVAAVKAVTSLAQLVQTLRLLRSVSLFGMSVPLLAVVAAALILYAIFDDIYTLMSGGESVIGDTLDELFGLGTAAQFAKDLDEALDATIGLAKNLGEIVLDVIVTPFESAAEAAQKLVAAFGELKGGNIGAAAKDMGGAALSALGLGEHARANFRDIYKTVASNQDYLTLNKEGRRRRALEDPNSAESRRYQPGGDMFSGPLPAGFAKPHVNIYGHPDGRGPVVINQHNVTKVDVQPAPGHDEQKVGDAVGAGVSTAQQRNNDKARHAYHRP